jgi:hypothetical protein
VEPAEHRYAAGVVLGRRSRLRSTGRRGAHLEGPVGSRPQDEQPDADNPREQREGRHVMDERELAEPASVHAQERDSGLQLRVDERVGQAGLPADTRPHDLGPGRSGGEPVRRPQPDARLVVPPRLHGTELERPGLQLRPHRASAGERPGHRQRAGRSPGRRSPRQREHDHVGRRFLVDHEHVLLAAVRGVVLCPVRRVRLHPDRRREPLRGRRLRATGGGFSSCSTRC